MMKRYGILLALSFLASQSNAQESKSDWQDSLSNSVQTCWNVGSLSSDALRVSVTVLVEMNADGTPGGIEMTGFTGGTEADATQAFEAARRAVIRCGASRFPLPTEKYEQWREIEMTFDPSRRIR